MPAFRDRRRAQAGTTLVELLVALVIISTALVMVVGALSTGALDSVVAKRNTAAEAVAQYEMDSVSASVYSASPAQYSECFATDNPGSPAPASGGFQGSCPGSYSFRADVTWAPLPSQPGVQVWTITVIALNTGNSIGSPISLYKVQHQ